MCSCNPCAHAHMHVNSCPSTVEASTAGCFSWGREAAACGTAQCACAWALLDCPVGAVDVHSWACPGACLFSMLKVMGQ